MRTYLFISNINDTSGENETGYNMQLMVGNKVNAKNQNEVVGWDIYDESAD